MINKFSNPLVSIGLPVYNGEEYLNHCLESLINQTYTNIEIIICDDNSEDKTEIICKKYTDLNFNINFCKNSKRLGVIPNMIRTLQLSKGKYFVWASQDDVWDKNFIKKLLESSLKNQSIISMCATQVIDIKNNNITQYRFNHFKDNESIFNIAKSVLCPVDNKLLKMSIFIHGMIEINYFRKSLSSYPGFFRSERHILIQLALSGNFSYVDEVLFFKRIHDDNQRRIGDNLFRKKWYSNIRNFFQMILSIIFSPIISYKFKFLSIFIIYKYLKFRFKIFIVPKLKKMLSRDMYKNLKFVYTKFINK